MNEELLAVLMTVLGFLLGAVPFGIVVSKALGQPDPRTAGSKNIVIAVVDTGINYLHEDLAANMWRNPGETGVDANGKDKASNGIDGHGGS